MKVPPRPSGRMEQAGPTVAPPRAYNAKPIGALAAELTGARFDPKNSGLGRGDSPRSGEPVHRNSYHVGQVEDRIWKPINGGTARGGARFIGAIWKAAQDFECETRKEIRKTHRGAKNGALGHVGLNVLKYLLGLVDYATGRLEPAITTIAAATGHVPSAVQDALHRLRRHGFLSWMRRSKPVENPVPGGPRVEQATNAYALLIPEKMKGWIRRLMGRAPVPECEQDRQRQKAADFQRMLSGLTATEYQAQPFNDGALFGPTLKALAALVDRREAKEGDSDKAYETGGSILIRR